MLLLVQDTSLAPLPEHVSLADEQLLWWMLQFSLDWIAITKIATTLGAWLEWLVATKQRTIRQKKASLSWCIMKGLNLEFQLKLQTRSFQLKKPHQKNQRPSIRRKKTFKAAARKVVLDEIVKRRLSEKKSWRSWFCCWCFFLTHRYIWWKKQLPYKIMVR